MMEYLSILLLATAQLGIYLWMDKKLFKVNKIWILIGILIAQIFIFPQLYLAAHGFDENQCGMPILAIHLFFLLMGGALNITTHIIYYFISKKLKTQQS